MFKQRLITTLILAPCVLLILYFASFPLFVTLMLALLFVCAGEWIRLIPLKTPLKKATFFILLLVSFLCIYQNLFIFLKFGLFLWGGLFVCILMYPSSQRIWGYSSLIFFLGLLFLPVFATSLLHLEHQTYGNTLVIYLLFLIWMTDSAAYLVGKKWGKHKLIPEVSPGKTWEGALAGLAGALLIAGIGSFYFKPSSLGLWFVLAMVTSLLSMVGDLFISMLKRRVQLKDTGTVLPGHGGVLDRLDSLIAGAPFFYYGLSFSTYGF